MEISFEVDQALRTIAANAGEAHQQEFIARMQGNEQSANEWAMVASDLVYLGRRFNLMTTEAREVEAIRIREVSDTLRAA